VADGFLHQRLASAFPKYRKHSKEMNNYVTIKQNRQLMPHCKNGKHEAVWVANQTSCADGGNETQENVAVFSSVILNSFTYPFDAIK
jgi:hypothetical protein